MPSHKPVIAVNGWLYRLLVRGPARVSLNTGTVRFESRSGNAVSEISVSSIDTISISRFLFWTRLTIRTAKWEKHSIGGLGKRRAKSVCVAIHEEAAQNIHALSEQLKRVERQRQTLFSGERYVRHSAAKEFLNEHQEVVRQVRGLCRLEREKLKAVVPKEYNRFVPFTSVKTLESERELANDRFVQNSIQEVRAAASNASLDTLTDEQTVAIATDEDTSLVLAGAGTGKTSVIIGKLAHLVHNQGVNPDEILVLAYNKDAAKEIRDRLAGALARENVTTFHSFGRRVVANCDVAPDVSKLADDNHALREAIDNCLNEMLEDQAQSDALVKFILNHRAPWRPAFEFTSEAEYDEYVHSVELRTLGGDKVKSFEELTIANFFAEHSVSYRYEAPYPFETATSQHRQYHPDFYLPDFDIYIEHFALDANGQPPSGWSDYAKGVNWKRTIHLAHHTKLIETYSWQHELEILLSMLRGQLEELGVRFERIPRETLIKQLREQRFSWLSALLGSFLNHVKTSNLSLDTLHRRAQTGGDRRRNERFLKVFKYVQARYEQLLTDQERIDFHDMIIRAEEFIRTGSWKSPFRYVLVDEFQDIAAGRMRLLESLNGRSVAYFLVGDDWQSIYRFAGSDVSLVKGCGEHLGHVQQRELTRTFRYGAGLLNPSTAFIQRNPEQTQRPLRTESDSHDLGITVVVNGDPEAGAKMALQEIVSETAGGRASVLVLGRFSFSDGVFKTLPEFDHLNLEFSTVHQAKGREADFVIVLDLKDDQYGFPARIEDDPLLELVLPPVSGDAYPFAEERRLFYVALTRARNGAWLITDQFSPSTFVKELTRESDDLRKLGDVLTLACPNCHRGHLVASHTGDNLRCSNHPRCSFLAPRCPHCNTGYGVVGKQPSKDISCTNPACNDPLTTCPQCGMGILVERISQYGPFLSCSAWVWSEPKCSFKRDIELSLTEYDIPF